MRDPGWIPLRSSGPTWGIVIRMEMEVFTADAKVCILLFDSRRL